MAEETQKTTTAETPVQATAEVEVVSGGTMTDKPVAETEQPPPPEPEKLAATVEEVVEAEKPKAAVEEEKKKITESASFKEETNVVGELPDPEKKALDELKQLVREALNKHEFTAPPPPPPPPAKEEEKKAEEEKAPVKEEEAPKPEEKTDTPAPSAEDAPPPPPPMPAAEEPPKSETTEAAAPPSELKEEERAPPPPPPATAEASEPVVISEVVEKATAAVDDDGGKKTVEAIDKTMIAATSAPAPPLDEPTPATEAKEQAEAPIATRPPPPEEVSIWGIPLLADERSDVILLKFLRARDFKVKEAFSMLKNTVRWRKEFGIEYLVAEDLGTELEKVVFMHGSDKEGHPVCYNAYGEFQNKELYYNTFGDEKKRQRFLRWRIQFLEKSIRKLDFMPDGICSFVQVNDLKNSPGPFKRELRLATNQALQLLQDNYPEFVAKQVFINVPWWYLAFSRMISPFFTQRTKSKFVFAGHSKSAETLFKYITPEQVPVQYGGLSREGEQEFTRADPVTEYTIKPTTKHTVEFPVSEACTVVWEARVVGWDLSYGSEFVPAGEGGYTVIIQKSRKVLPADETVICGSFKISEPGKVVLVFDNQSSKKKKLLYRFKTKPSE